MAFVQQQQITHTHTHDVKRREEKSSVEARKKIGCAIKLTANKLRCCCCFSFHVFDLFLVCHQDYITVDLCLILNAAMLNEMRKWVKFETGAWKIRQTDHFMSFCFALHVVVVYYFFFWCAIPLAEAVIA